MYFYEERRCFSFQDTQLADTTIKVPKTTPTIADRRNMIGELPSHPDENSIATANGIANGKDPIPQCGMSARISESAGEAKPQMNPKNMPAIRPTIVPVVQNFGFCISGFSVSTGKFYHSLSALAL
jgi:hypothetical protein